MSLAPIILFVYNRPWHTRQTVEALQKNELAAESDLFIFADGPKPDANEEIKIKINEVRQYIHTIKGFRSININESPTNIGLDISVINGVSTILSIHKRCIVIEDDIITHPFFLRYVNEALILYENNKQIQMIGGFSHKIKKPFWYNKDFIMVPRCCSWGWGIWEDRWTDVDWEMRDYDTFISNPNAIANFCRGGSDLINILMEQKKQKIPAWDITWDYSRNKKNGFVLIPIKSLTINIGLDGTGVHCGVNNIDSRIDFYPLKCNYDLHLPKKIKHNKIIEKRYKECIDNESSFIYRIIWSIKKRLKIFYSKCSVLC